MKDLKKLVFVTALLLSLFAGAGQATADGPGATWEPAPAQTAPAAPTTFGATWE